VQADTYHFTSCIPKHILVLNEPSSGRLQELYLIYFSSVYHASVRARAHTHTHTHTRARARARARTHTHAHTHREMKHQNWTLFVVLAEHMQY